MNIAFNRFEFRYIIQFGISLGTNQIHGKKCMIHGRIFKMCQISRKTHGKSFGNSRATQTLFQGAVLMQTKKFQNNEYLLH